MGDVGSGTEANANQILGAYDITYDDINEEFMGFGDASTALQDGNIDAAFVTAGTPTASIQELAASADVKIVGLSDEKIDQLIDEYPYYTRVDLDEDTYDSFDATASTVAPLAMLVVRDELPEDQVYELTKAIFNNLDDLANAHVRGEDITLDSAQDGMSIDLHPGAKSSMMSSNSHDRATNRKALLSSNAFLKDLTGFFSSSCFSSLLRWSFSFHNLHIYYK